MAFNYFYIKTDTTSKFLGNESTNYPVAIKSGDGVIDVFEKFRWKNRGNADEVPRIGLTEYKLNYGTWAANLIRLWNGLTSPGQTSINSGIVGSVKNGISKTAFGDPYQNLYIGEPTGFYYSLPYLKDSGSIRGDGFKNSWDVQKGLVETIGGALAPRITEAVKSVGEHVMGGLTGSGWGAEELLKYSKSTARSLTITFPLYNTFSLQEANDHFSFVSLFAFQNMKTRTSYMTYLPPKVYVVDSMDEGGIYMPIAYVSDFKVESIGTLRRMSDFGAATNGSTTTGYRMIPEAYKVTIVLTEMIPESTNIMQGALGEGKVKVIGSPDQLRPGSPGTGTNAIFSSSGTLGLGTQGESDYFNPYRGNLGNDTGSNLSISTNSDIGQTYSNSGESQNLNGELPTGPSSGDFGLINSDLSKKEEERLRENARKALEDSLRTGDYNNPYTPPVSDQTQNPWVEDNPNVLTTPIGNLNGNNNSNNNWYEQYMGTDTDSSGNVTREWWSDNMGNYSETTQIGPQAAAEYKPTPEEAVPMIAASSPSYNPDHWTFEDTPQQPYVAENVYYSQPEPQVNIEPIENTSIVASYTENGVSPDLIISQYSQEPKVNTTEILPQPNQTLEQISSINVPTEITNDLLSNNNLTEKIQLESIIKSFVDSRIPVPSTLQQRLDSLS